MNVPGELTAHCDFRPFDPIDSGIPSRATSFNADLQPRNKPQIHEMLGDGMVQFQLTYDGAFSDSQVGQCFGSSLTVLLASEYEVENHFQLQPYSNPFPQTDNDQSHT